MLRELQSEGALTAEQSLRVKEWLCSVEEERSGLTTASGPDSGIENSSTEDSVALRRGRPSVRNQVCLYQIFKKGFSQNSSNTDVFKHVLQTRIQRLRRSGGATSMKVRKMDIKRRITSCFKHRSIGWRERTQTF